MKLTEILVGFVTVAVVLFLFVHFLALPTHTSHEEHHAHVHHLSNLAVAQNSTIQELQLLLAQLGLETQHLKQNMLASGSGDHGATRPARECDCPPHINGSSSDSSSSRSNVGEGAHNWADNFVARTKDEQVCDLRYGMGLVEEWRANKEVWCESDESTAAAMGYKSQLECYPYHQNHKKLDGRGPDMFCVAKNFVIDFSKISGDHTAKKQPLGQQYFSFASGSLQSTCKKTNKYQSRLFMPHHALQMRTFQAEEPVANLKDVSQTVDTSTFLLARDEDFENSFHSTADFMNMFLVKSILGSDMKKQQVMLWDRQPDGPYIELINKAYSPLHPVLRRQSYNGGKVLFRELIFHLESPAGLIFPKVSRPDPLRCYDTSLFDAYRRFVLQSFDLLDVPPPPIPAVVLSLRHRTAAKNVGRVMANEEETINVLKQGNMMDLKVVDTSTMSYYEQLKLIRSTNVLVGVHGAGLMFIMFAAEEAVLVEIHPSYRQDRHFRHAARMTGKIYMPLRAQKRESCHGSSDSVTVPLDEFRLAMDGALRVARNFDDGLSECGLVCPGNVLAIDNRLDGHYQRLGMKKVPSINTHFPC